MDADAHPARPFAYLAALAFLAGFAGYLAVSVPLVKALVDQADAAPARVSGPSSAEWNPARRV